MKAFDFEAVQFEGIEMCVECLPKGITVDDEDVTPIFASDERTGPVVCDVCRAEHDYMNIIRDERKFFQFELHESDGNDNHISEFFVRAENEDAAWNLIDAKVRAELDGKITHDDGDTDSWHVFYDRENTCPNGEECEEERCSGDHRTHSLTFYAKGDSADEPEGSASPWHPWLGEWEAE